MPSVVCWINAQFGEMPISIHYLYDIIIYIYINIDEIKTYSFHLLECLLKRQFSVEWLGEGILLH